jgi:hypothetical protein
MLKSVIPIFLFSIALACIGQTTAQSQDCSPAIPQSLKDAIAKRFPDHRVLALNDMNEASGDAKMYRDEFGNKCPGVTTGDFDGNGQVDYGLYLLKKATTAKCILIAALAQRKEWDFEVLCDYHECYLPGGTYIKTLDPGDYESMLEGELTNEEIREGYVARLNSKRPGIYFGVLETEGTAYFRTGKRWVKLEL